MANEIQKIQEIDTNENATNINQITSEKLFEGATMDNVGNAAYDSREEYVFRSGNSYQPILDQAHYSCIQNGYWELQNPEYTEYFTEDGNKFIHHIVPDTSTWQGKLDFSNTIATIAGLTLFNIPTEDPKIYDMETNSYYDRVQDSEDYEKVTEFREFKVLDQLEIDWDHPYTCRTENKDGETLYIWSQQNEQQSGPLLAETGNYLYVGYISSSHQRTFGFFHITFDSFGNNNDRVSSDAQLYKLPDGLDSIYLLRSAGYSKLTKLDLYSDIGPWPEGTTYIDQLTFKIKDSQYDPNTAKFYSSQFSWSYPNVAGPTSPELTNDANKYLQYTEEDYPSYTTCMSRIPVDKKWNDSYTIFKKTAKIINYRYTDSGSAQPLQLIFTDKNKAQVLNDCGLTQTDLQGVDSADNEAD